MVLALLDPQNDILDDVENQGPKHWIIVAKVSGDPLKYLEDMLETEALARTGGFACWVAGCLWWCTYVRTTRVLCDPQLSRRCNHSKRFRSTTANKAASASLLTTQIFTMHLIWRKPTVSRRTPSVNPASSPGIKSCIF
jgi:hypothetical protein